jgi:hypothetical protein
MLSKKALFLAAAVAATGLSLLPSGQCANAQVMFIQRRPVVIVREQPAIIIREQPAVVVHQAPSAVLEETPVLSAPLGSVVIEKTVTQSALVSATIGPISDFLHRLDLIGDQISLGLQNGMLSADAAARLSDRTASLRALADGILARGTISDSENDALETQINLLNQDVARAMMQ